MAYFILRLDDACPQMNQMKWHRMEELLDQYKIQPVAGIIPDNRDKIFTEDTDSRFWEKCRIWQEKHWTIAQHGLHHTLHTHTGSRFQMAVETATEMAGKPEDIQFKMILKGYEIMKSKGIIPVCFFAPCHTFDKNTVRALNRPRPRFLFVSDGYALRPYVKQHVIFLPAIFDTPHKITGRGVQTFIFHPNNMTDSDFCMLETFLKKHAHEFVNAQDFVTRWVYEKKNSGNQCGQGIIGRMIEYAVYFIRRARTWKR